MKKFGLIAMLVVALLGVTFFGASRSAYASGTIAFASAAVLQNTLTEPGQVDVSTSYTCSTTGVTPTPVPPYTITVTVNQPNATAPTATGTGSVTVTCDGTARTIAIDVTPNDSINAPFNLGNAVTSATITDSAGTVIVAPTTNFAIKITA